jgi:hypothetical protein
MAHKTLIGGTAYEISGGKTLIGGTAYSIKNGKTLVGGTAYEVEFGEKVIVKIVPGTVKNSNINTFNADLCRVTINGVVYDGSSTVEVAVAVGTVIECYINGNTNGSVYVGDTSVLNVTTGKYNHTVTADCQIALGGFTFSLFGNTQTNGFIYID